MTTETHSAEAPPPLAANMRSYWTLDPEVAFLNHGSFGACPRIVLEEQSRWRTLLEREPVHFFERIAPQAHHQALIRIAQFVGADVDGLAFVTNATEGVHAVVRSMDFSEGDEIITTAHRYDAVGNLLVHVAERCGATVHHLPVDLPFEPDRLVARIEEHLSSRTRLVVVDHITSISALIYPVKKIIDLCRRRGVDVCIDGAHAPGQVELEIESLNPAYYTGNLHKWVCAPKGAAFLWVREDRRDSIHPSTISNNYGRGFREEFAWQATRDITPWLSVPAAIEFFKQFDWQRVREHNHALAVWANDYLCGRFGVQPISDPDGRHFGSMCTVPLPEGAAEAPDRTIATAMLYEQFRVEAPVVDVNGRRMIRPSCHIYNAQHEYARLADAVLELWG